MYFSPYPRTVSRDMTQNAQHGEMDISHRYSQQLMEWLKSLFARPFEAEDRTKH
jgi:hypothetical protein